MEDHISTSGNYMYLTDYVVVRAIDVTEIDDTGDITFDTNDLPDGLIIGVNAGPDGTSLVGRLRRTPEFSAPAPHVQETRPTFIRYKELSSTNGITAGQVIAVWLDN